VIVERNPANAASGQAAPGLAPNFDLGPALRLLEGD
jgi:hypothetical protein